MEEVLSYILSYLAAPTLLGVVSFFIVNFVGKDFVAFRDILREVLHAIEHTANVSKTYDGEERLLQSIALLRGLGTRLSALRQTSSRFVKFSLQLLGYDLEMASRGLIGLSNSLKEMESDRLSNRYQIEEGLKFSHPISREMIEEMARRDERRNF